MVEDEPLTKEQMIAVAAQLRGLRGTITPKPTPDVVGNSTVARTALGFTHAIARLNEATQTRAVLEMCETAFLIAAGEKPPVIKVNGQEIALDLSGSSKAGEESIIPEHVIETWEHTH